MKLTGHASHAAVKNKWSYTCLTPICFRGLDREIFWELNWLLRNQEFRFNNMECHWRGKTEALREKRILLQLCPPQSPHGAAWNRILSSAMSSWRLTSPVHTVLEHTSVGSNICAKSPGFRLQVRVLVGTQQHLLTLRTSDLSLHATQTFTQTTHITVWLFVLDKKQKSHNDVRIWRQEHAWCSYSSAVSNTSHWLLLTFKSQGNNALVSLADLLTGCSLIRSHDIGLTTAPRAQQMLKLGVLLIYTQPCQLCMLLYYVFLSHATITVKFRQVLILTTCFGTLAPTSSET